MASPPTVPNRLFHDETVLLAAFSKPRFPRDDDAPHHGFHPNPPGLVPRVDADVGNPPIGGGMDGWMSVALLSHSSVQLVGHSVFVRQTHGRFPGDRGFDTWSIPGFPRVRIVRYHFAMSKIASLYYGDFSNKTDFERKTNF